jgi:hypothetical protein
MSTEKQKIYWERMKGIKHTEERKRKMSETHKKNGDGKWNKGRKHTKEQLEKMRLAHLGKKRPKEFCEKMSKIKMGKPCLWSKGNKNYFWGKHFYGEKSPSWQGGKSFEPYSVDWNECLRRSIRERDKYICQKCNEPQGDFAHDVHHIDYDKKNCNPSNLITLCHICHLKINKNKDYWTNYFREILDAQDDLLRELNINKS